MSFKGKVVSLLLGKCLVLLRAVRACSAQALPRAKAPHQPSELKPQLRHIIHCKEVISPIHVGFSRKHRGLATSAFSFPPRPCLKLEVLHFQGEDVWAQVMADGKRSHFMGK